METSLPRATPRAFIALRVSTAQQEEKYGLDTQEAACREYLKKLGVEVAGVYGDIGVSGTSETRPAFGQILEVSQRGDWVVVYDTSRLARDVEKSYQWLRLFDTAGLEIHSAQAGKRLEDTFEFGLASLMGHYERTAIVTRLYEGQKKRGLGSERLGLPPMPPTGIRAYAFVWDKNTHTAHHNPAQAETVRRMYQRAGEGLSHREIARQLNAEGIPSPWAGKVRKMKDGTSREVKGLWTGESVAELLQNPINKGELVWGGRYAKRTKDPIAVPVPPIVSPEEWALAQRPHRSKPHRYGALTGFIFCAHCGERMSIVHKSVGRKTEWWGYLCNRIRRGGGGRGREGIACPGRSIPMHLLERSVRNAIEKTIEERWEEIAALAEETRSEARERDGLDRAEQRWLEAFREEAISAAELKNYRRLIDERRAALSLPKPVDPDLYKTIMRNMAALSLRELLTLSMAKVTVGSADQLEVHLSLGGASNTQTFSS